MGERQFEKPKKPSMKRRCEGRDYQGKGFYMITIETLDRRAILGRLEPMMNEVPVSQTANLAQQGIFPSVRLSTIGRAIAETWRTEFGRYPQIERVLLQVMPDHIHGLLYVKDCLPMHLGLIIRSYKNNANKQAYQALKNTGKLGSARVHAKIENECVYVWTEGYNDSVIKNKEQLERAKAYIKDNPRRLWVKRYHPDFFAPLDVEAGGHCFSSIGNAMLLNAERLIPVHVSSRQTEEERQKQIRGLIEAAKEGAVLVSPFISKGEKVVEHALEELKLPVVKLLENGFGELYKPAGKSFDACAEGRLLLLAPWEHHNERLRITREQCLALNQMAADICSGGR